MKPRFRLHLGIWHCVSSCPPGAGLGYTPLQAWRDWQQDIGGRNA